MLDPNERQPDPRRRVVMISGPTATGKSLLALRLAEIWRGTVINADSMQVYDALPMLTARPGAEVLSRVPHRLFGVIALPEACSAARWHAMAEQACFESFQAGRLPILVGGTGLYLRTLTLGLAEIPAVPQQIRHETTMRYDNLGGEAFRAELRHHDPITAARLAPGDRQRLIRAWEVWATTGRPLPDWHNQNHNDWISNGSGKPSSAAPLDADFVHLIVLPDRRTLYTACDQRFEHMLAAGALEEVADFQRQLPPPDHPICKALGVPELMAHLAGRLSLEQASRQAKTSTRRYAKRQTTWLRHQVLSHPATGPYRSRLIITQPITESLCGALLASVRARLNTPSS